jgi:hypothetical protein
MHYFYGVPITDKNTGNSMAPFAALMLFLAIGGGGAFFLIMGVLLRKWTPSGEDL